MLSNSQIRSQGFKGKIISFEPLTGAHKILKKISKSDDLWEIYPRVAIGCKKVQPKLPEKSWNPSQPITPILATEITCQIIWK